MCFAERPLLPSPISIPTLVETITRPRFPPCASQLPMMASDSPPRLPGTHRGYVLAVSTKLIPCSSARSSSRKAAASWTVHAKTLPPSVITGTFSPVLHKFRFCMYLGCARAEKRRTVTFSVCGRSYTGREMGAGAEERELVQAAQADPAKFGDLYDLHFETVYGFIARRVRDRATAEDLTSDVFHKALANLRHYEWRGAPF